MPERSKDKMELVETNYQVKYEGGWGGTLGYEQVPHMEAGKEKGGGELRMICRVSRLKREGKLRAVSGFR